MVLDKRNSILISGNNNGHVLFIVTLTTNHKGISTSASSKQKRFGELSNVLRTQPITRLSTFTGSRAPGAKNSLKQTKPTTNYIYIIV